MSSASQLLKNVVLNLHMWVPVQVHIFWRNRALLSEQQEFQDRDPFGLTMGNKSSSALEQILQQKKASSPVQSMQNWVNLQNPEPNNNSTYLRLSKCTSRWQICFTALHLFLSPPLVCPSAHYIRIITSSYVCKDPIPVTYISTYAQL